MNYERSPFECLTHNYRGGRPCPYCAGLTPADRERRAMKYNDGQDRERRTQQISDAIDKVLIDAVLVAVVIMFVFAWWGFG